MASEQSGRYAAAAVVPVVVLVILVVHQRPLEVKSIYSSSRQSSRWRSSRHIERVRRRGVITGESRSS